MNRVAEEIEAVSEISYESYEAYRATDIVADLKRRQEHTGVKATHLRVIHTLDAMRVPAAASWYWQHAGITCKADLERELP